MKKKLYFCYDATVGGKILFDTVDGLMEHLLAYLVELKDDDEITFECGTKTFTEEELKALP